MVNGSKRYSTVNFCRQLIICAKSFDSDQAESRSKTVRHSDLIPERIFEKKKN